MRVVQEVILTAGNMASASLTSENIILNQLSSTDIQCVFTGAPVGTLKIQTSADGSTWSDWADSSYSIAAAGDVTYLVEKMPAQFMRVVYTKGSGTGALTVTIFSKEI